MKRICIISALLISCTVLSAQERRTLSLDECLQIASSENVNVKNSHLDYMSAKMQKKEALFYYFPVIDVKAMGFNALNPLVRIGPSDLLGTSDIANTIKYGIQTIGGLLGINTTYETLSNAYGAAVTLMQPVYAGGKIVNSNRLAKLGVQAADLNQSIARRDVVTDIEKKYWLAVSLEEKMSVIESGIAFAESLYKDAVSAYASGLVTDYEKGEVEAGLQDLKAKRIRLKGSIMLARMDLCNAIGLESSEAYHLYLSDRLSACSSPESYYVDPSQVAASMEESKLLELSVEQKKLEKKIAMGDALPQIGLGASYSYGRLIGTPQNNGALYATVKIPITDWSKVSSKMKNLDYQMEKAENQRDYLRAMLELQLRQLWVEVESSWEELSLKEDNASRASLYLDRTKADVNAGISTISTLMKKQLDLSQAECDKIDARIAYRNAVAAFQARVKQNNNQDK